MSIKDRWKGHFFADAMFETEARLALGHAPLGARGIGLTLKIFERIDDGDADSWFRSWNGVARLLHDQAASILAAGHPSTSAAFFIAASDAYARSIAFSARMIAPAECRGTFARHRACWESFIDALGGRAQRLSVVCGNATLPIFIFRPDDTQRRRPTLVITGGTDAVSSAYASGARAAIERDWNVVVYDGPGQGVVLVDQHIEKRPDWEGVLTPIVDALLCRGYVDGDALFAYGKGLGGYLLSRALAFEHRFVAAVIDPGMMDISAHFASIPRSERYHLRNVASQIQTPLLVTAAEGDEIWQGQSEELYQRVSGHRELAVFSAVLGADGHGEPLARNLVELRMFDFFGSQLRRRVR